MEPGHPQVAAGPWYLTMAPKTVGTVAGVASVILGVVGAIGINPLCIVAGVLQVLIGLTLLACEAPFLVGFMRTFSRVAEFAEGKHILFKVVAYLILGIVPLLLCSSAISIILACICVLLTAVSYGISAIGKRGQAAPVAAPFTGTAYSNADNSGLVESGMRNDYSYNQNLK